MNTDDSTPVKVIAIGIGGATSSGKTTLAKHLRNCLPNSFIIHQDDFVPPAESLPMHPELGVADWDSAPGAIDWDRMAAFLSDLKRTGILPTDHQSYDHLNTTASVAVEDEIINNWKTRSEKLVSEHLAKHGEKVVWAIIDGFLMYWDERIISDLDVRVFIRTPEDVVKARREARPYVTPEGEVWHDPPHYWEKVVWPAYIQAHEHIFIDGDVLEGTLNGKVNGLLLFEGIKVEVQDMVNTVMEKVVEVSFIDKK
ncbi:P-loop containing nucleoside triphosphate hydrolase protein [Dendrothele bispora CBS 962.96]|uniref:P-loop containing nucleoside triphosphate hydrolase protein n=1 Tax=Dendrothele bispora (strain CBS 962.96) TaxID=1314807 RepID=A0A4S8KXI0_DENBC|nr:P-loop containing nucleoside triphosphate hydrolase protein [Dendrothele bispora CBS 962.96]